MVIKEVKEYKNGGNEVIHIFYVLLSKFQGGEKGKQLRRKMQEWIKQAAVINEFLEKGHFIDDFVHNSYRMHKDRFTTIFETIDLANIFLENYIKKNPENELVKEFYHFFIKAKEKDFTQDFLKEECNFNYLFQNKN